MSTLIKTLQEEGREKLREKYGKEHIIKSEPEDYIHDGLNPNEFISHLLQDVDSLISNAVERGRIWNLPEHKGELSITHNGHKSNYETVEEYLRWMKVDDEDISPEDRKKCIETDEIWECQWYPNTPVGFNKVYAPTLSDLLAKFEGDNK